MNTVLNKMEHVAEQAADRLNQAMTGSDDVVSDSNSIRDNLAIVREYTRLESVKTARVGAAIKLAGALGLKKQDLLPVWGQLTGQATIPTAQ